MALDPDQYTAHYGFRKIRAGEPFSKDSYKFTVADRDLQDLLLFLAAEGHHHTGESSEAMAPEDGPTAMVQTSGGSLPAGNRYFYVYTIIDPNGFESVASPEVFVDMPPAVASPAAPALRFDDTGGTLPPGNYYYALTAYTGFDNLETETGAVRYISVPYSTQTNKVTLTLPSLPAGADGFNVYRRTPSGIGLLHVAKIEGEQATFVDGGALVEDCDRFAPTKSTATSRNSARIKLPDDFTLPAGYAWRIYRGRDSGIFTNGVLATITDGSREFIDVGGGTLPGQPPVIGIAPGAPSRIQLTNAAEVQGRLPLAQVSAFPHCETFSYPGDVVQMQGTTVWTCPFPQATIVGVQASLGRGSSADNRPVIVDVNWRDPDGNDYLSIFTQGARPSIAQGQQVGARATPDVTTELVQGDQLTVDIAQEGGGADRDLTVVIYMLVYGYTMAASHPWVAPHG